MTYNCFSIRCLFRSIRCSARHRYRHQSHENTTQITEFGSKFDRDVAADGIEMKKNNEYNSISIDVPSDDAIGRPKNSTTHSHQMFDRLFCSLLYWILPIATSADIAKGRSIFERFIFLKCKRIPVPKKIVEAVDGYRDTSQTTKNTNRIEAYVELCDDEHSARMYYYYFSSSNVNWSHPSFQSIPMLVALCHWFRF